MTTEDFWVARPLVYEAFHHQIWLAQKLKTGVKDCLMMFFQKSQINFI